MSENDDKAVLDGWEFHGLFKALCLRCQHKSRTVKPVCAAFPEGCLLYTSDAADE